MYSNRQLTDKPVRPINSIGLFYDCYVDTGSFHQFLSDKGIPQERIVKLGSLRYTPQWVETYKKEVVLDNYIGRNTDSHCRVVVFLMHPRYNSEIEIVVDSIRRIVDLEHIEVVVKPHPRRMPDELLNELSFSGKVDIATQVSSVSLVEWADVAIAFGSSIAIQALLDDKVFLYPSFFDTNKLFATDAGACWECPSPDSLVEAVCTIRDNPGYRPYSNVAVRNYLKDNVYAGMDGQNVLQAYPQFIDQLISSR